MGSWESTEREGEEGEDEEGDGEEGDKDIFGVWLKETEKRREEESRAASIKCWFFKNSGRMGTNSEEFQIGRMGTNNGGLIIVEG